MESILIPSMTDNENETQFIGNILAENSDSDEQESPNTKQPSLSTNPGAETHQYQSMSLGMPLSSTDQTPPADFAFKYNYQSADSPDPKLFYYNQANYGKDFNQNQTSSAAGGDQPASQLDPNQQQPMNSPQTDTLNTKEYYDFYNSQDQNSHLAKPTYNPFDPFSQQQMRFSQQQEQHEQANFYAQKEPYKQHEEFEQKLSGLTLDENLNAKKSKQSITQMGPPPKPKPLPHALVQPVPVQPPQPVYQGGYQDMNQPPFYMNQWQQPNMYPQAYPHNPIQRQMSVPTEMMSYSPSANQFNQPFTRQQSPYHQYSQMYNDSNFSGMQPQYMDYNYYPNQFQNQMMMPGYPPYQGPPRMPPPNYGNNPGQGGGHGNKQHQQREVQNQLPKSPFLEDLRMKIQSGRKIEIKDIKNHVVESAMDQYGSRFIQLRYDVTTADEKQLIFQEILPESMKLMTDVFGNYVVQKMFEYGSDYQRATLADQLLGSVFKLTKSMYGCRVVQKALEFIPNQQQKLLVDELKDNVMECVFDQNGNHVIQKCIEKMPAAAIEFIVKPVTENTVKMCKHTYGCRVIQRILENCQEFQTGPIIAQIVQNIKILTMDQFGNYVVQHVLEYGKRQEDKNRIVYAMKGNILEYSNHKFASNVIEKCLGFGMPEDKKEIIQEILEGSDDEELQMTGPLFLMMKDRYGNYVIQKCIEVAMGTQKDFLIKRIQSCANILKKQQNYSRHVYNFLEKVSTLGMEKKPSKGK